MSLIIFCVLLLAVDLSHGQLSIFTTNTYNHTEAPEPQISVGSTARQARKRTLSDSCLTDEDTQGTCMTRFNCMLQGGSVKGYCGTYGVCCETNLQCGATSKLKRIIIRNPVTLERTCNYRIEAYSSSVCQLLIEFERFELKQPTLDVGQQKLDCTDYFTVDKFTLCGDNTQQHLYIPFRMGGNEVVQLTFELPDRWRDTKWRLIVTQLECPVAKKRSSSILSFGNQNNLQDLRTIFSTHHSDWDLLAPIGCDQFYRDSRGTIKSFNYQTSGNTYYMAETNYAICIKPVMGSTMIEYTTRDFSMSSRNPINLGFDENCHSTVFSDKVRKDYLMIPQSLLASNMNMQPTYYCGNLDGNTQVTILGGLPYVMYFYSDELTDTTETGFSIDYAVK
ncbi:uncharacterized protein LOC119685439 [Teleopsis dalmanni]|uniref:uncharacterized protein LOC119685439 n=1 Tax=Teleopsis dalmanni TaxID=139649 RepID=UPI000D32BDC0|nr:uncharacterized protein LOC119685439 [Teleopsis dalmanni]